VKGNDDVIELLLTKGRAQVDQTDTAGNTALLCAAKVGNVATMDLLVTHGASIDAQNKLGETIWHYAIRQDDNTLLKAIAGLYRKAKSLDRGTKTIKFASGRNPLQVGGANIQQYLYVAVHVTTHCRPTKLDQSVTQTPVQLPARPMCLPVK